MEIDDEKLLPVWLGATEAAYPLYKWVGLYLDRARIAAYPLYKWVGFHFDRARISHFRDNYLSAHVQPPTPQSHLEQPKTIINS